jgi:hypothetical protein
MPRSFRHLDVDERIFIKDAVEPGNESGWDCHRSEASPFDHPSGDAAQRLES